jgi:hypothetical protein
MVFDASTSEHLKPWLTKTLEPMSVRRHSLSVSLLSLLYLI